MFRLKSWSWIVTLFALMTMGISAHSQHLLVKSNDREYVGVQISEKMFKACGNREVPIDDGKITNTGRKCSVPNLHFTATLSGLVVEEVNVSSRTFKAQDLKGGIKEFYFPEVSEGKGKVWFATLKPGDRLTVDVWEVSESHDLAADQTQGRVWVTNEIRSDHWDQVFPTDLE